MPPSTATSDPFGLRAAVARTLAAHEMLSPGDRVLLAVSGGPDSMALLHILHQLAPQLGVELGVAHLHHGLRDQAADRDEALVRQAAATYKIPFHSRRARTRRVQQGLGLSLEDAARRVRYAFLTNTMAKHGYTRLALGHQRDDNAEQVLLALLRGTGPRGLAGIAPVRDHRFIRPLIELTRQQIEAYVKAERIETVIDQTNDDTRFLRNRIRHKLLPDLADSYNPRIKAHLTRLAEVMRTEEQWIDGLVADKLDSMIYKNGPECIALSTEQLATCHPALVRRLTRMALARLCGHLHRIGLAHIQAIEALLATKGPAKQLHLPGGIQVQRSGRELLLRRKKGRGRQWAAPAQGDLPTQIAISGPFPATIAAPEMGLGLRLAACRPDEIPPWDQVPSEVAFFDLDRLRLPLILRQAKAGDRFHPLGAGGRQKLKKYFADHHICASTRWQTPVIADTRHIIWLVGQRIDDSVKVTGRTRHVLKIEFYLLDRR